MARAGRVFRLAPAPGRSRPCSARRRHPGPRRPRPRTYEATVEHVVHSADEEAGRGHRAADDHKAGHRLPRHGGRRWYAAVRAGARSLVPAAAPLPRRTHTPPRRRGGRRGPPTIASFPSDRSLRCRPPVKRRRPQLFPPILRDGGCRVANARSARVFDRPPRAHDSPWNPFFISNILSSTRSPPTGNVPSPPPFPARRPPRRPAASPADLVPGPRAARASGHRLLSSSALLRAAPWRARNGS